MKYLTIQMIKDHSRIDSDCELREIEMYADSAEMTMAQYLNRGKNADEMVESLVAQYGEIPAPIIHATLELVDQSYTHRSPASPQQMYAVPYNFDILVKPFMIL